MTQFDLNQKIGDIVAEQPEAMNVFKRHKIDFCCGGDRPLAEAIREQNLNPDQILQELAGLQPKAENDVLNFREMGAGELADYIVRTHHAFLDKILPELSELSTKILRVHCKRHGDTLFKLHSLVHQLKTALEQHLIKEEAFLFPMLKEYERDPSEPLRRDIERYANETETEHDDAGKILKEMRKLTDEYRAPSDACATYRLTFKRLEELESDLFQHIHLENNILLKRPMYV